MSDLIKKWGPVLDHPALPKITNQHRRAVTAQLLEQSVSALKNERDALFEAAPTNNLNGYSDTQGIAKFDPVLISLIRRTMPQLIAHDVCGVQPLKQPTGLIFAMRSRYGNQAGNEAFFNEANSAFSGDGAQAGSNPTVAGFTNGTGMTTSAGEALGSAGGGSFGEMAITIEKVAVEAKTRALKAEYSLELAQDLKALHGLDAESELTNILSAEILTEINREIIRTMYIVAKVGAQVGTTAPGVYDLDLDSNGRWSVERFKGLMFQLEREANAIGQQTRRGRGNFIICSADVASALSMAGKLDYAGAIEGKSLNVDDTSGTFAGTLNGQFKVYVDPYIANSSNAQFAMVGYKGSSAFDAGLYYAPYVPLQLVKAVDPNTFAPKLGFKTRYGLISNPFAEGTTQGLGALNADSNAYLRKFAIAGL